MTGRVGGSAGRGGEGARGGEVAEDAVRERGGGVGTLAGAVSVRA